MARLSRKLRVCKWVGTVGCLLLLATWIASGWWQTYVAWSSERHEKYIHVLSGVISYEAYSRSDEGSFPAPSFGCERQLRPFGLRQFCQTALPSIKTYEEEPPSEVGDQLELEGYLPLWLPFLVLLMPTLLLWRRDRRSRSRPGFCRVCDYDLTGNTSGRCPECGTPYEPASDGAAPPAA